jgi:hypothetical protein
MNAESMLLKRARRAYEFGRFLHAMRRAATVAPMVVLSLLACGRPTLTVALSAALMLVLVVSEWKGQALARGSRLGVWACLPPLLLPLLALGTDHVCRTSLCGAFPAVCVIAGGLGGAWVALHGRAHELEASGLAIAAIVAILGGSLGCLVAGLAGLVGVTIGVALGASTGLVWRRS